MKAKISYETLSKFMRLLDEYKKAYEPLRVVLRDKAIKARVNHFGPYRKPRTLLQALTLQKGEPITDNGELINAWVDDDAFLGYGVMSRSAGVNCVTYKIRKCLELDKPIALGLQGYSPEQIQIFKDALKFVNGYNQELLYPRVQNLYQFSKDYFQVGVYQDEIELNDSELEVVSHVLSKMPSSIEKLKQSLEIFG